ncbi:MULTISPECIES: helix-turn-helix domain-containing protein [Micromonospora]|uniref:Helix-turn-helix domain-containing protein n=1 Tax=Micromonospora sicca TaxID=2202420 RepID=A0ABU5JNA2_9ACTN|nr:MULTISPECIES: helix-turn-helix domain-containing protein [unclassified Micromonospora]MDZ5447190.1 helix-turn-helix domain-containing protein [Micromonospora sp. 4G57]MDZ5493863.1 helix-turn-helix domain-containing protein [Micromonospora sp. 4G53]
MDSTSGGRQVLRILGLGEDEEQVYRALLRVSAAGPAELARQVPLPADRVARALAGLRDCGLVAPAGAEPDPPLRPLPPDVALGDELLRQQQSLDSARRRVAQLTEEYRAGVRRHDADHLVEIVTGPDALRARLRRLQDDARVEVLWFCRANPLAMPGPENVEEFAALARGVSYRAIYERDLLAEPDALADVEKAVRSGEQARVTGLLPVRLAIADRATAVCPLVPERASGEASAAVIGRSQLLDALLALFDSHWTAATPLLPGAGPAADGGPDADERLLLSLFVAGVPDKSIASQLGVSRRTIQRRLADLMTLAGVDTRPGLAYQAARRGWL